MSIVHVAVGLILNQSEQILIALRKSSQHQGGLWEFPGGKVEPNESVQQALVRELKEEVNVEVLASSPFIKVTHDYGDKQVLLEVLMVTSFNGQAEGMEGQEVRWVSRQELGQYDFPKANKQIVAAIYSYYLNQGHLNQRHLNQPDLNQSHLN